MGGMLHLFDFNQASTSRKLLAHNRHNDGLEAPRNSLELPMEASQSYHVINENIPYSCQVKQQTSKMNLCANGTPMKKLIDEEMSNKVNARRSTPSVVARLMGMDTLPSETKQITHAKELKNENSRSNIPRKEQARSGSTHYTQLTSTPSKQTKQELLPSGNKLDSSKSTKSLRLTKPQPREHPQEELLQKFKKEFEAWQASKVWESSKALELHSNPRQGKDNQILAQENLNKEKMARYADTKRMSAHGKASEPNGHVSRDNLKINTRGGGLQHEGYVSKQFQSNSKEDSSRNRTKASGFQHLPVTKFDEKHDRSSSPTRIVILKPSSERSDDIEDSWVGSSEIVEKEGSMEDFLEEVKEKLRYEIQGKARSVITTRMSGTETPFGERSTDPKQIARHIAKQIRESVTRDLGMTLMRSESTRSYRSEVQFNGPDSPEFINKDTRKLLSERLKNVLKNETDLEVPLITDGKSGTSLLDKDGMRLRPVSDFSKMGRKVSYWEDKKALTETKTRSFRREKANSVEFDADEISPRNLVRSFSAPVTGTAFAKLLLEDQHVLTGAHIRRKHEASEHTSLEARKNRKDGFNLKGRVSNFRHNFTLRGRLFGKKTHSAEEPAVINCDSMKPVVTAPSVVMNFGVAQDNSTEVPPSPASVSSTSHDDYCRPGHPSPVSPLEVPFTEDQHSPQVSGDFCSNLPVPELGCLSEQVEIGEPEEETVEEKLFEYETVGVEGHAEAFVKDILVAAGLYEGESFDHQAFSRWDALAKPISKRVFEEVEAAYSKYGKVDNGDNGGSLLHYDDTNVGRRMLFDLLNEALPTALGKSSTSSTFKRRVLGPTAVPHGKRLLDDLWRQIRIYINPTMDEFHSLDSMVAWDVRTTPWPSILHEDIDVAGREMESLILGELIDEFVWDMFY